MSKKSQHRTWEVGLLEVPLEVPGVERPGLLFIIDQDTATVRVSQGMNDADSIRVALQKAIDSPEAGTPGVPDRLLVQDEQIAGLVRAALGERRVPVEVGALPVFDDTVASLLAELGGDEEDDDEDALFGPGVGPAVVPIESDQPRWAAALSRLVQLAPWRTAGTDLTFRFSGHPGLDNAVATFLDGPGLQIFDEALDHEQFLDDDDAMSVTTVEILGPDEVDPDEAKEMRERGLELTGGRFPQLSSQEFGDPRYLHDDEKRVVLAALQAVVALCAAHPDLAEGPRELTALTVGGPVTVRCAPAEDEPAP